MVRILIAFRSTITRNQLARGSTAAIWAVVAFGVLSAAGTLAIGIKHGPGVSGPLDRVSAVLVLWLGGQLAQAALNGGDAALRPELLALLPLSRRRLAWALLAVGLCDPALVIVGAAYAAVIAVAAGLGAAAVVVAVAGVAGLLVLTSVAVTLAGGTLGPGSRRGRDLGTVVLAVAISFLSVAATLLPTLLSDLQAGRWHGLAVVLRVLPTGWPGDAVAAAHRGQWPLAVAALLAPALLAAPFAVVETVALTAWSGQHALWPWALGLLIALLGGAVGLAPLASLISVQPLDDGGNPTPAWSLKVHIALIAVSLTAAPAAAVLTLGTLGHDSAVSWAGVAVAAVTAAACAALLGTAAVRRLQSRQVTSCACSWDRRPAQAAARIPTRRPAVRRPVDAPQ
jgi:hypothetical protein